MRCLWSIVVLLTLLAYGVQAQQPDHRRGLWIGLGAGPGSVKATCSICGAGQGMGLSGQVGVGGTVSRRILAGVEAGGWLKRDAAIDRSFWVVSALATLYPAPDLGFHVKAGVGGYGYEEVDSLTELTTQGMSLHLGVGYDLRITPGVSLSPFGNLVTSGFGNPTRTDKATGFKVPLLSDMKVRFFQLGIAATLH